MSNTHGVIVILIVTMTMTVILAVIIIVLRIPCREYEIRPLGLGLFHRLDKIDQGLIERDGRLDPRMIQHMPCRLHIIQRGRQIAIRVRVGVGIVREERRWAWVWSEGGT